jgi:uncharacterized membrane protein YecN with MAPEG domain
MTNFEIVAFYLALTLLLNIVLMLRVGNVRLSKKINLGDGGDDLMLSRIRAHGNFIENAPLMILGLLAIAMLNGAQFALHILGAGYFIGRVLHAMGMSGAFGQGRLFGTLLTLIVYIVSALYILYLIFLHGPT